MADTVFNPTISTRFTTLDALRGVGALFVVLKHSGLALNGYQPTFSYLPVDMFFILSGFVLAYANDRKFLAGMSAILFMKSRIVRLYPVYVLGLIIGLLGALTTLYISRSEALRSFAFNLIGFPTLTSMPYSPLFALDSAFWSLFFEFWVANLFYAILMSRKILNSAVLGSIILFSGICLIYSEHHFHTMDVGWSWSNILPGFGRVGFSFFAGVALARFHRAPPPKVTIPSWVYLIAFSALLMLPLSQKFARIYEMVLVVVVFPVIIFFAAKNDDKGSIIGKILGETSYAVYSIHRPVLVIAKAALIATTRSALVGHWGLLLQAIFVVLIAIMAIPVDLLDAWVRPKFRSLVIGAKPQLG